MKRSIIALSLVGFILMTPLAFAQTATSTNPLVGMTNEQAIAYLEMEIQSLMTQIQAILATQASLSSQVSSTQAKVNSASVNTTLGSASAPIESRTPYTNEEAQMDFGSGLKRTVDIGNSSIAVTQGTSYPGILTFFCSYSHVSGLPDTCTPNSSSESSFPSIVSPILTANFQYSTRTGVKSIITQIPADSSGNFSLVFPKICGASNPMINVLIKNQGYNVYQISSALDRSAVMPCN